MESGAHAALLAALWADTAFLAGQGVMDYSLLVGVDRPGRVLVVGIIDFLRQARSLELNPNPIYNLSVKLMLLMPFIFWSSALLFASMSSTHCVLCPQICGFSLV